jgi:hypothetical protein
MSTRVALAACAGLIIAPLLWAANIQLGEILPYAECGSRLRPSVVISALFVVAAGASALVSRHAASLPAAEKNSGLRFVANVAALLALVLAFALALQAIAGIVLTGCER